MSQASQADLSGNDHPFAASAPPEPFDAPYATVLPQSYAAGDPSQMSNDPVYVPSGYPPTGYPVAGYPEPGYPQTGYPQPGYPQTGYPQTGYPQTGYPQPGYPQPGYPQTPPLDYPPPVYPAPGYPFPPAGFPGPSPIPGSETPPADSTRHLKYAVEILIFAFVGWAWLAVREYLGPTPVLDVAVIILVLCSAAFNLLAALIAGSAASFAPFARAFSSHVVIIGVLYIYSLAESMGPDTHKIRCTGPVVNATLSRTYATAFFGGVTLHQVLASVTVPFLFVLLLIACAQSRACTPNPGDWLLRGTPQAIAIVIGSHLLVFTFRAPLASTQPVMTYIVAAYLAILALVVIDFSWLSAVVSGQRSPARIVNDQLIQTAVELISLVFVTVLLNTLSLMLFDIVSWPLIAGTGIPLLSSIIMLFNKLYDAYIMWRRDPSALAQYNWQYSQEPNQPIQFNQIVQTNQPIPAVNYNTSAIQNAGQAVYTQNAQQNAPTAPAAPPAITSRFRNIQMRLPAPRLERQAPNINQTPTNATINQAPTINWDGFLSRPRTTPYIDRKKVR